MKSALFAGIFWFLNVKFHLVPTVPLFVGLFAAIGFDLITGVAKARMKNELVTSYGYRKTIIKLSQYFGTLVIVIGLRYLVTLQKDLALKIDYLDYGIQAVLIFAVFIEVTSSLENIAELDNKSPFSKYIIQPLLRLLTFQLKNNPFKRAADQVTILVLVCVAFTSCMSVNKATKYLKVKDALDSVCASNYPVLPEPPDTTITEKPSVPQEQLDSLENVNLLLRQRIAFLQGQQSVTKDSSCNELVEQHIKELIFYNARLESLQKELKKLKSRDTTIEKTKIDSAALSTLRKQAAKQAKVAQEQLLAAQQKLQKANNEMERWKAVAIKEKGQLTKSVGLNILFVLLFLFSLYRGIKRKGLAFLNPLKLLT